MPVSNTAQQYITQIWNKVPNPTDAATLQLDFPDINVAKFRQEIIRVDHTVNNRLSFFYRFEHDKIPTQDADGTIGGRSNLPFVNRTLSDSPGKTHTANMIYTPSANMIFEGRFTYGYGAIFIDTVGLLAKSVSPIAVNLPYTSARDTVPIVSVAGFNSLTGFSNYIDPSSKTNYAGNVTWIHGNHSMKFGGMFSQNMKNENALSGTNQGQFSTFSNTIASVASPACVRATGVGSTSINTLYQNWACFMMGNNVTFTQSKLDLTVDLLQKSIEGFVQDEWRARNNLTVSLGVRYSYFGPPYDRNGVLSNFVPSLWRASDAPVVTGGGKPAHRIWKFL